MLIKNDPNIKEIEIFEYCYLYTAHADNTIFFVKDKNSIVNLSENLMGHSQVRDNFWQLKVL